MTSIRRPIAAKGATKNRWQAVEDAGHRIVLSRVAKNRGQCEAPGCDLPAVEDAHLFSRGRVSMSAPWCHSPHLRRGLCKGHHTGIDRNVLMELRDQMRWEALVAFLGAEGIPFTTRTWLDGWELDLNGVTFDADPLDLAHAIDRLMHERFPEPAEWELRP